MVAIQYTETFLRDARRLPADIRERLVQQTDRFREDQHDPRLHAKALHGRLAGTSSFWVTRNYRVLYRPLADGAFVFLAVDDRKDIYR